MLAYQFAIKYFMRDLVCDVIVYCAWTCDMGKCSRPNGKWL